MKVLAQDGARLRRMAFFAVCVFAVVCALPETAHASSFDDWFSFDESASPTEAALRDRRETMRRDVQAFYEARDFKPAWSGSRDADERAASVRTALEHADRHGLNADDYLAGLGMGRETPAAGNAAARYDIALTSALLRYARDVRTGRVDPASVYRDVKLPAQSFDAGKALAAALRRNALGRFLADLPPPHAQYGRLVDALARIRAGSEQTHRIGQIVANMERWRWLPRKFEDRYILVNVPEQSVIFVRDKRVMLRSRVVIGRRDSPTPIMRTTVKAVVANPPWDIPRDIAARQLLPKIRADESYLSSRNIVLKNGDAGDPHGTQLNWGEITQATMPRLRQRPGADNFLGKVMLDSPNAFGVYMHDTPGKELFRSSIRTMSNGCVRVEKIFELASLLLAGDIEAGRARVDQAVATGKTGRIALDEPLPVYILYWTAAVDKESKLIFRPDRYRRDPPLIAKLLPRAEAQAPAPVRTAAEPRKPTERRQARRSVPQAPIPLRNSL